MRSRGLRPELSVLVTGASSGLGRALSLLLAQRGHGLFLTGRDETRLADVAQTCRDAGAPWVETAVVDLAEPGGPARLIAATQHRILDALVNNAGAGRWGPWLEGSLEDDRRLVQLLVLTPLELTRHFASEGRRRGRGAVLTVASTGAFQPGPLTAVYYASKAFLVPWSLAVAREERSWLTMTVVCPGALRTGFASAAGRHDVVGAPGPEAAARAALKAWDQGRRLVVPGWGNRVLVALSRLAPMPWVAIIVEALQRSLRKR